MKAACRRFIGHWTNRDERHVGSLGLFFSTAPTGPGYLGKQLAAGGAELLKASYQRSINFHKKKHDTWAPGLQPAQARLHLVLALSSTLSGLPDHRSRNEVQSVPCRTCMDLQHATQARYTTMCIFSRRIPLILCQQSTTEYISQDFPTTLASLAPRL